MRAAAGFLSLFLMTSVHATEAVPNEGAPSEDPTAEDQPSGGGLATNTAAASVASATAASSAEASFSQMIDGAESRRLGERENGFGQSQVFGAELGRDSYVGEAPPAFMLFGIAMFGASAGDLASTELALSREGTRELNPMQTRRGIRVASHLAAPALVWWLTERTRRERPKLALLMRIGVTVGYSYVVMHNLRVQAP
jgi:hypothetical protein